MRNPLQTTITHAEPIEPVLGGFSGALERSVRAVLEAARGSGLVPRGLVRARITPAGAYDVPLLVSSLIAGGHDLPHEPYVPPVERAFPGARAVPHVVDAPDLEADGYGWPELAEPTC